jgi:hypothetical protein
MFRQHSRGEVREWTPLAGSNAWRLRELELVEIRATIILPQVNGGKATSEQEHIQGCDSNILSNISSIFEMHARNYGLILVRDSAES